METMPKTDWPEMVMHSISLLVIPSRPLLYAALTLRQFRFPQIIQKKLAQLTFVLTIKLPATARPCVKLSIELAKRLRYPMT